jgi:hypothetical protein
MANPLSVKPIKGCRIASGIRPEERGLKSRIYGLAFQSQHAEHTLVHAPQRLGPHELRIPGHESQGFQGNVDGISS